MFPNWLLVVVSIGYIGLLFAIAFFGDRYRHRIAANQHQWIYALSLGVYCTSWGFLGTAGQASVGDFSYLPVYLAPIVLFLFGWPFIQRLIRVSLRLNITSIADLLAARFGKSQKLAVLVTLVALFGTLPYLALQIKAIVNSYEILRQSQTLTSWQLGLIVSAVLAGFTIIFGVRAIDVTERHPGVMVAIAFESLLKLLAFLVVGLFVSFIAFDSPAEIWQQAKTSNPEAFLLDADQLLSLFGLTLIVLCAFLCLPRQFQVTMAEPKSLEHTQKSRWLFPLYVLVFAFFAAPLGLAGNLLYGDSLARDSYVLFLPAFHGQTWLSLLSFLGAISAASAMVIISTIALSTMLSNEVVFPTLFKQSDVNKTDFQQFRARLLQVRKYLVLIVIALSYTMFLAAPPDTLASLGEVAFGAIAQIGPALFAAFYWRKVSLTAVISGLSCGFGIWVLFNLAPQLGLYPHPFANSDYTATTLATLLGLTLNTLLILVVSKFSRQTVTEQMQLEHFFERPSGDQPQSQKPSKIAPKELQLLAARFVGADKAAQGFSQFATAHPNVQYDKTTSPAELVLFTEDLLATVMGSASARLVLDCAMQGREIALNEVVELMEEVSSQRSAASAQLLKSAIENASEGISVTDNQFRLVAWNQRYLDLFQYPQALIYPGCPVADLIAHNLSHSLDDQEEIQRQVAKRLQFLRLGSRHSSERQLNDGTVIRIEGNPMPDGGFVMLFSDITAYREAQALLTAKNLDLESLVSERTQNLAKANEQLARSNAKLAQAREQAEQAHRQKSRYLKACSHDLMQPLSAAKLFSAALMENQQLPSSVRVQLKQIDHSLKVANDLLVDLNEVSRINSGNVMPKITAFPVAELLDSLHQEFAATAHEHGVRLEYIPSSLWIRSDKALLRRILQNLLSNACRYASGSRILLGCRHGALVRIQVVDTGPGIPKEKQDWVFGQFNRLEHSSHGTGLGLGLGLNIAQSLAQLMGHELSLNSQEGKGCCFSVSMAATEPELRLPSQPIQTTSLEGVQVLCVDNDPNILAGMEKLLSQWQCQVIRATCLSQARRKLAQRHFECDIMLVDYQLDNGEDGLSLMQALNKQAGRQIPGILISATTDAQLQERAKQAGFGYLKKLIKPITLRAMISAMLVESWQHNYLLDTESAKLLD
ncbi:hybrid sensor histidine kinase/response regulator [Ferrimonas aestuarii]|uniref:histidine kinase n=1 Tax=Ferrimonas aestuarii TaxID=2569539 RepID=A0A4U1BTX4_9GAMM|nr:PAS domain-containing hybrid sensor histidine kinase/response regulator [Ferrimonas aestuarii]TKB58649.1 response regulator [Ferrimonas aestuarii]